MTRDTEKYPLSLALPGFPMRRRLRHGVRSIRSESVTVTWQTITILLFHSVKTGNIIKLLSFLVLKIPSINLEHFDLGEDVLVLVLGGSTLIIPEKYNSGRSSGQVENL